MSFTPETLAEYHSKNSVSFLGETFCTLCKTGVRAEQHYPWPCPVWVAAHPEDADMIRDGYGLDLLSEPRQLTDEELEKITETFDYLRELIPDYDPKDLERRLVIDMIRKTKGDGHASVLGA